MPANYYHNFKNHYKYPNLYQYKHFIRFTDTGHYAALLMYYNKHLPISHNITLLITVIFWIAKCFFNMEDDTIKHPDVIKDLDISNNNLIQFIDNQEQKRQ